MRQPRHTPLAGGLAYHAPVSTSRPNGYARSWYVASALPAPVRPPLEGAVKADVAVLGAGYTGLSAALELACRGHSVVVLEAGRAGWGASGRNGGQVLAGFGCEMGTLERQVGREQARRLFDYSLEGIALLRSRIDRYGIDCHWQSGAADVALRPAQAIALQRHAERMQRDYDHPLAYWDRHALRQVLPSERFIAGLHDPAGGHLHPLRYAQGLARAAEDAGARICEHSPVTAVQRGPRIRLQTPQGHVEADHAVIAGNALLGDLLPALERRIIPVGTYVGATPPLGAERARALIRNNMAVADVNWALDYFHLTADHRLLFGGMASYSALPPPGLAAAMTRRMHAVFPQLSEVALESVWGGLIDITRNRAPHFGRLDPNLYFAQGFSGHGVAATGLAGDLIARAIDGQASGLDAFAAIGHAGFPGGRWLRRPLLMAAMSWYKLRDRLG